MTTKQKHRIEKLIAFLEEDDFSFEIHAPQYLWEDRKFWIDVYFFEAKFPQNIRLNAQLRRNKIWLHDANSNDANVLCTRETLWRTLFLLLHDMAMIHGIDKKPLTGAEMAQIQFRNVNRKTLPFWIWKLTHPFSHYA